MKEGAVEGWRGEEGGTKRRSGQGPLVLDFQLTPFCVDKRVPRAKYDTENPWFPSYSKNNFTNMLITEFAETCRRSVLRRNWRDSFPTTILTNMTTIQSVDTELVVIT